MILPAPTQPPAQPASGSMGAMPTSPWACDAHGHEDVAMPPTVTPSVGGNPGVAAGAKLPLPPSPPHPFTPSPPHPLASTLPTDDAEFREIVEEFIQRAHQQREAIERAWAERDFEELARLAHWLKGAGGTAGFAAFTEPAKHLEQMVKTQQQDEIPAALEAIAGLMERMVVQETSV
jgi:HPt (histidine-containing phosphotransfer) domain-containing protein